MSAPLPDDVRREVEAALREETGRPRSVATAAPVGGGCVNRGLRLDFEDGDVFFLKWNGDAPPRMFGVEADGLSALGGTDALRVPAVVATARSWLLLEFVPEGRPGAGYAERLGRGLAELHRSTRRDETFGWSRDNFIGSLPQANDVDASWPRFWRDRRLAPQLERARSRGFFTERNGGTIDQVLEETASLLSDADGVRPALLHGDLWSGNCYPGPEGEPVLVDPAVYRGHAEVDLAMTELFGGFPPGFSDAYREAGRVEPSYARRHRPLYQLYYLLVHVNLFGGGYVARSVEAAERALRG